MTDSTASLLRDDGPLSDGALRDGGPLSDGRPNDSQDERYDDFLGALTALGGSAGNGRLRDVLGWDEASYDTVTGLPESPLFNYRRQPLHLSLLQ